MQQFPRTSLVAAAMIVGGATTALAQSTGRLSQVIPEMFGPGGLTVDSQAPLPNGQTHSGHFNSGFQSQFTQFNVALASQVASVPIPSPAAGFTYTFDADAGVFKRSTGSFGPIFGERAETIGRHKFSFGVAWQHFTFDEIGGIDLDQLPAVFTHDEPSPGGRADVVTTVNDISAKLDQVTTFFTIGLTDRLDLSIAIPLVSAELSVDSTATVRRIGTVDPKVHYFANGEALGDGRVFSNSADATGVGDIHLRGKMRVFRAESTAVAMGLDLRLPSGDEDDLLGTGAVGVAPFVAVSTSGKIISTHLDASYQWNGDSVIAGDLDQREKGDLPDQLLYVAGLDFAVHDRVTLAVDLLGQIHFDTPVVTEVEFRALDGRSTFPDVTFGTGTITQTSLATGLKINVVDRFLFDANVTFALDDGGLRDKVTPLFGVEYSF